MRRSLVLLVVLTATLLFAQQADKKSPRSQARAVPAASDPETVATAIRDSYYHPDEMSGFDCAVSVYWPAFFSAMKVDPPAERLKAIQGLTIRFQSVRGESPSITFQWTNGSLNNKEQFEDGLRQTLGGFDQMYWYLLASPLIRSPDEITKLESLPDGGARVHSVSQNTTVVITIDKENIPTHYTLDSPALRGTIDLRYIPSPKPAPGDLRRISGIDVSEHIGTSVLNVKLSLDYQSVEGFYVPGHVSYDVGGAYSLSMGFTGCTVSKRAIASKIQ